MLLTSMGRDKMAEVYSEACIFTAEHIERWWDEIDAVAARLKETGYLVGAEVVRIIEFVSGKDNRRP